jgi:hypothetical protein
MHGSELLPFLTVISRVAAELVRYLREPLVYCIELGADLRERKTATNFHLPDDTTLITIQPSP